MTPGALIFIFVMVCLAVMGVDRFVKVRYSPRALLWNEEEQYRLQLTGQAIQQNLNVLQPVHPNLKALEEPNQTLDDVARVHATSLRWDAYANVSSTSFGAVRWRIAWAVIGLVFVLLGGTALALTPLRNVAGILGALTGLWLARLLGNAIVELQPLRAQAALDRARSDKRPPVLLLRNFKRDNDHFAEHRPMGIGVGQSFSVEGILATSGRLLGSAVAVGRPEDKLPAAVGALRLYIQNEHWQLVVSDLMRCASVVIVRMEKTAGLRWELHQLAELGLLRKCIFVTIDHDGYPSGRKDYTNHAIVFAECTGVTLPTNCWNSWFFHFADGTPEFCRSIKPWIGARELEKVLKGHFQVRRDGADQNQ